MLNKETLHQIAKSIGVDPEDFEKKITSEEETELEIPEGLFFTEEDLSLRDKDRYETGRKAGEEMLVKSKKQELGYDFEGKSIDDLMSAHVSNIKSKYEKEEPEKVKELKSDLENIKQAMLSDKEKYESEIGSLKKLHHKQQVNNRLLNVMPKNTVIPSKSILTLFNSEHEIATEGDDEFVLRNGEKLKDHKTQAPLKTEDVFNEWLISNNLQKTEGRGGGNDYGGNGYSPKITDEEFQENWKKDNPDKHLNSQDYMNDYREWQKSK